MATKQQQPEARIIKWERTEKQHECITYLEDSVTTEVLFGGGAGGAKSFTGCGWAIMMCLTYKGIRGLIARETLKDLKESTLLSFFDICSLWQLRADKDFSYNKIDSTITFFQTGSVIYLSELSWMPSDPEYERLGSKEYTFAFIDEASQITEKAKNIVRSRIRYKLDEYGLIPKLLMTTNPTKNFIYLNFYLPWKNKGRISNFAPGKVFIQSLVTDNPFVPQAYIDSLRTLDPTSQERLLRGNWEYDADPRTMMDFDAINDIFTNNIPDTNQMYMTVDVARKGRDRTVIVVWNGLNAIDIDAYDYTLTTTTEDLVKQKAIKYRVPFSRILVDDDGVGGGVVDHLPGVKAFNGGAKPHNDRKTGKPANYLNMRSQCSFKLADLVNKREIGCTSKDINIKALLVGDLEVYKERDIDGDGKKAIIKKDDMKDLLGRSPDVGDTFMMRMWFELQPVGRVSVL